MKEKSKENKSWEKERRGGKIGKKIMTGERKRGCEIRGWKEEISEEKMKKMGNSRNDIDLKFAIRSQEQSI